jgi:hypothetical protein
MQGGVWHTGETPPDIHFEQPDGETQLSRTLQIKPSNVQCQGVLHQGC